MIQSDFTTLFSSVWSSRIVSSANGDTHPLWYARYHNELVADQLSQSHPRYSRSNTTPTHHFQLITLSTILFDRSIVTPAGTVGYTFSSCSAISIVIHLFSVNCGLLPSLCSCYSIFDKPSMSWFRFL